MKNYLRKKIADIGKVRKIYIYSRYIKFQIRCIYWDIKFLPAIYRKSQDPVVIQTDTIFVCSLEFYKNEKWQVVSQADLWYRLVEENDYLIIGSFVSYWLIGRNKKNVISLEPKFNAPKLNFSKKHNKVVAFVSDSHSKSWLPKHIKKSNITDILTPYRKPLLDTGFHEPLESCKVHSFPWCVSESLLNGVSILSRNTVVLGFGASSSFVYDLRNWSFETGLLESYDYAGSGNKHFSSDDYYYWLRSYDASVVAVSTNPLYNITVAKFFEIPSQGLLLFAFKTVDLEDFGFIDGVNYISVTKENFNEKIKSYKSEPNKYLEIRKEGYELIKSKHTVNARLAQIKFLLS